jgi:hypothetical protein
MAGVVSVGGSLYGTTSAAGADAWGTVYELTPPTTQGGAWTETTIHTFAGPVSDGAWPLGALTVGPVECSIARQVGAAPARVAPAISLIKGVAPFSI